MVNKLLPNNPVSNIPIGKYENTVRKGEKAGNPHMLLSSHCPNPFKDDFYHPDHTCIYR